jgi:hypothetical protein
MQHTNPQNDTIIHDDGRIFTDGVLNKNAIVHFVLDAKRIKSPKSLQPIKIKNGNVVDNNNIVIKRYIQTKKYTHVVSLDVLSNNTLNVNHVKPIKSIKPLTRLK